MYRYVYIIITYICVWIQSISFLNLRTGGRYENQQDGTNAVPEAAQLKE